jgi:Trp operon repressor
MNKAYEKKLIKSIMKAAKDEKLLKAFLDDILTTKEHEEIVHRYEILVRLLSGETQRSIVEDLGLGIATVTRGSHLLSEKGKAFKKVMVQ